MKKNKKDIEEKVYSIEELAEFIHTSPLMSKGPKKPMSLFTKILIFLIILALVLFIYFKFFYVPYIYTIEFNENTYNYEDYTFITKDGGEILFGDKTIELDENISNILLIKDYENETSNYAIFLSNHGNLYLYDIDTDNVSIYYNDKIKVSSIDEVSLDNITAVEATFENGIKRILSVNKIYDKSSDDVKIMDKIIYGQGDIYVYIFDGKLRACRYSEVTHYDIKTDTVINSDKITKSFVNENKEQIEVIDYYAIQDENENNVYIYIISKDGNLNVYNLSIEDLDNLPNEITLKNIYFNSRVEGFVKDSELINGARIKLQNEDYYIDIIKDKLLYGSLSNDKLLIAYSNDIYNPKDYEISSSSEGNNKFKGNYYVVENIDSVNVVFITQNDELMVATLYFDKSKKDETRKVKLDDNVKVNKLYQNLGTVMIEITKTIHKEYVVFENETEYITESLSLTEFLKGVEYYE